MTRMWRGPSQEHRSATADPLYCAIVRRLGRLGVHLSTDVQTGRIASVFRLREEPDGYVRIPLGEASGPDPWAAALHAALDHSPLDTELVGQYGNYLDRQLESVAGDCGALLKLAAPFDDLAEAVRERA